MERVVVAAALLSVAACAGPREESTAPKSLGELAGASISIYRDGDRRFSEGDQKVVRFDGTHSDLEGYQVQPPVALVIETTTAELRAGRQAVSLPRVPAQAAPSSLWLQSRSGGAVVLESVEPRAPVKQNMLGKKVRAHVGDDTITGTVVGREQGLLAVRTAQKRLWLISPTAADIEVAADRSALPIATVDVEHPGIHPIEVGYSTASIDWLLDYQIRLDGAEVSIAALLTISNQTDSSFDDVALRVFSGSLRAANHNPIPVWDGRSSLPGQQQLAIPLPAQKLTGGVRFEYRPSDRAEKGDRGAPTWGQSATATVARSLWLKPADGAALFAGKVAVTIDDRLYDGVVRRRVIGPATASIRLESAPDLLGRRRQLATRKSASGETLTETIEIGIHNRGTEPRSVTVVDTLRRSPTFRLEKSKPKAELAADELRYQLDIESASTKTIVYTVQYSM